MTSEKVLSLSELSRLVCRVRPQALASEGCGKDGLGDAWHVPGIQGASKHAAALSSQECLELTCPIWQPLLHIHGDLNVKLVNENKVNNPVTQCTSHKFSALLGYRHRGLLAPILDSSDIEHCQVPRAACSPHPSPQSFSTLKLMSYSTRECTADQCLCGAFPCPYHPEASFPWTLTRTHAVWPRPLHSPAHRPCKPSVQLPVSSLLLPSLSLSMGCSPRPAGWSLSCFAE